ELQTMAGVVGLREVRYGYDGANHFQNPEPRDNSNPYFSFEPAKCIVCSDLNCRPWRESWACARSATGTTARIISRIPSPGTIPTRISALSPPSASCAPI